MVSPNYLRSKESNGTYVVELANAKLTEEEP